MRAIGPIGAIGIAYSASWVAGLCSWPSNPSVTSTARDVTTTFAAHSGAAVAQYTLTEGLPAVGLAVLAVALGRRAGAGRATVLAGLLAAAVSALQWVLGLILAGVTAPHGSTSASLTLFQIVDRMDGVKMFLLAGLAAGGVAVARRGALPRRLGVTGGVLAALLVGSGIGYLLLAPALTPLAYLDGPLLLVWVTATSIVLGRRRA
jgi:hypothetical protein